MRTGLLPYLGQQVLCRGWIASWVDVMDSSTRRVVVKQPTIRKADRNLLFSDQVLLSTEHHLNLFIDFQDLPQYDTTFQVHEPIQFSGVVQDYVRSDGSTDIGIAAERQSTLPFEIERVRLAVCQSRVADKGSPTLLRDFALPQAKKLLCDLEEAGDMLPTFRSTYATYRTLLEELINDVGIALNWFSSRDYRRLMKKKGSLLRHIQDLSS